MFYRRGYIDNNRGFSAIEVFIAAVILSVILGGLFAVLSIGDFSFSVNTKKLEVSSQARVAMDWITKDVRKAISWNIAAVENNPTTTHLKFNLWSWNTTTNTWDLSNEYIEYEYDAIGKKLTRRFSDAVGTITSIEFNDIIEAPFYTNYVAAGGPTNVLDALSLRDSRMLIVVVSVQKSARANLNIAFNLKSEVRIRNG